MNINKLTKISQNNNFLKQMKFNVKEKNKFNHNYQQTIQTHTNTN